MQDDHRDIDVAGEVVARLIRRGQSYVLYSLDERLRDIDEKAFRSMAEAREAVLVMLDKYTSES